MSDVPNDPTSPEQDQPSQEEVQAYLEQLRSAPVEQVVAEVASALLNAAQVKLGRRDGRLLIDLVGDITERGRGVLPDEITSQLDQALQQLRLAQVEAERDVTDAAAQGRREESDLGDPGRDTTSSESAERPPPSSPPQGGSRLWVPGQ